MQISLLSGHNIICDEINICFAGTEFDEGIELSLFIKQLNSVNELLKYTLKELVDAEKIDPEFLKYKVSIIVEKGSIIEKIKIDYTKPSHVLVLSGIVFPLMVATYSKGLDLVLPDNPTTSSLSEILNQPQFAKCAADILIPVEITGGTVTINNLTGESLALNQNQVRKISDSLNIEQQTESDLARNGDFHETRLGVIRKLDLDATANNYFGFNLNGGKNKIPTSIEGEFHLNEYKEIIDKPIKLTGIFKYKNDEVVHITIRNVELMDQTQQLSIEMATTK